MTVRFTIAVLVLAALPVTGFLVLKSQIQTAEYGSTLVNVAGRQRMVSQRIPLLADQLVQSRNAPEREAVRLRLLNLIQYMEDTHADLLSGNPDRNLPAPESSELRAIFHEAPRRLNEKVAQFLRDARTLVDGPEASWTPDNPVYQRLKTVSVTGVLLEGLDALVQQYEAEDVARVARIESLGVLSLVTNVAALGLTWWLIFLPMARGIQEKMEGLEKEVGERKAAEEALRTERNFSTAVVETVGALIVVLDSDGRIVGFNRACEEATGYSFADVRGKFVWDQFILPDEVEAVRRVFSDLKESKVPTRHENYWRTRDDRHRWIEWSNTVILDSDGTVKFVIGTGVDVTDQRRLKAQIQHQEKMAAAGQLAAGVAHEIGNPLASISGTVQVLRRKSEDTILNGEFHLIQTQIDRISKIVRQMLDLTRRPRQKWRACSVNDVLRNSMNILRFDRRAKNVQIDLELDENLPATYAMEDSLSQVFVNLTVNALDAVQSVDDGRLRIETGTVNSGDVTVIRVVFEDNGSGVPAKVAARIFEPFFTTKSVGKGTGLGLSVSYGILQEHGASLRHESPQDGGARFVVEIPIQKERPRHRETAVRREESPTSGKSEGGDSRS